MIDFKNYKRISNLNGILCPYTHYCQANCKDCSVYKRYNRLYELENLIEQGKLVEKIEPKTEMTKEQQIEEMVNIVKSNATKNLQEERYICTVEDDIIALYNAGYRKKEEIEKQVAKEILDEFWKIQYGQTELDNVCIRLAEKYGVRVD